MRFGFLHKIRPATCTNCGTELDGCASAADDDMPGADDFTVCSECGHVMAYTAEMTLRDLTDAEMIELAGDPVLLAAQHECAAYKAWIARRDHIAWAKDRALAYVEAGDCAEALASFVADLSKHDGCDVPREAIEIGVVLAEASDAASLRKFIQGLAEGLTRRTART